jgi:hypothetical protein
MLCAERVPPPVATLKFTVTFASGLPVESLTVTVSGVESAWLHVPD